MSSDTFAYHALISLLACVMIGVSGQRQRCLGPHRYCSSWGGMKAVCKDGYCVCTGQDYDYETCLPNAYRCRIVINANTALGKPLDNNQQPRSIYSCTPSQSSPRNEVHVLAVYEAISARPPTAPDATVNIVSHRNSSRPIILVLTSYRPINWILNLPQGVNISRVILVAFYASESSVKGDISQVMAIERSTDRRWDTGYGSDSGGGNTPSLLRKLHDKYGVVTSFTGTYRANKWSLVVSLAQGQDRAANATTTTSSQTRPGITSPGKTTTTASTQTTPGSSSPGKTTTTASTQTPTKAPWKTLPGKTTIIRASTQTTSSTPAGDYDDTSTPYAISTAPIPALNAHSSENDQSKGSNDKVQILGIVLGMLGSGLVVLCVGIISTCIYKKIQRDHRSAIRNNDGPAASPIGYAVRANDGSAASPIGYAVRDNNGPAALPPGYAVRDNDVSAASPTGYAVRANDVSAEYHPNYPSSVYPIATNHGPAVLYPDIPPPSYEECMKNYNPVVSLTNHVPVPSRPDDSPAAYAIDGPAALHFDEINGSCDREL